MQEWCQQIEKSITPRKCAQGNSRKKHKIWKVWDVRLWNEAEATWLLATGECVQTRCGQILRLGFSFSSQTKHLTDIYGMHRQILKTFKVLPSPTTFPAHFQWQQNSSMDVIVPGNSWRTGTKFPLQWEHGCILSNLQAFSKAKLWDEDQFQAWK